VAAIGRKRLSAVIIKTSNRRFLLRCDALVLSLGLVARDGLLRQAKGLPVIAAGDVAEPGCTLDRALESGRQAARRVKPTNSPLNPVTSSGKGFVCLCEDVLATDLSLAWREGFHSIELLKRYTTVAMGPCQGALCQTQVRAFVASQPDEAQATAPLTARPPSRPLRVEDAAAGRRHELELRTTLHERHLELGATMEPVGGWKRPSSYGDSLAEYWAVRNAVSVMDVGTLGKFLVAGRGARDFLDRLYPCHIRDLESGRTRYTVLLNEAGHVIDDGMICALGGGRWYLTFTSGGAEQVEAWMRDWIETWGLRVHLVNETGARGAINLAGPHAREVLTALVNEPVDNGALPFMRARHLMVANVPCLVIRLGFVGELSYELHHPSSRSVELWDSLLAAGRHAGIKPHGLEALRLLRLEKGHVIVGQDTDFASTPKKVGLDGVVKLEKRFFIGKRELERNRRLPLRERLAPITFRTGTPAEGASLTAEGQHVGYLTSCRFSPVLERAVSLGWLNATDGHFPRILESSEGLVGEVTDRPFYDPLGERLRA
jgi:sarcosine oxidase subunit alpha